MIKKLTTAFAILLGMITPAFASEADLVVPNIQSVNPDFYNYLLIGIGISVLGLIFGFIEFVRIRSTQSNGRNR